MMRAACEHLPASACQRRVKRWGGAAAGAGLLQGVGPAGELEPPTAGDPRARTGPTGMRAQSAAACCDAHAAHAAPCTEARWPQHTRAHPPHAAREARGHKVVHREPWLEATCCAVFKCITHIAGPAAMAHKASHKCCAGAMSASHSVQT